MSPLPLLSYSGLSTTRPPSTPSSNSTKWLHATSSCAEGYGFTPQRILACEGYNEIAHLPEVVALLPAAAPVAAPVTAAPVAAAPVAALEVQPVARAKAKAKAAPVPTVVAPVEQVVAPAPIMPGPGRSMNSFFNTDFVKLDDPFAEFERQERMMLERY